MAATYKRVLCEVDGIKFHPNEARYHVGRAANQVGRRIGESIQARATVWLDAHDTSRLTQKDLLELWKVATESKDPLHKLIITYYAEDGDKVLSGVEAMAWISSFEFSNPAGGEGINNLLQMEFTIVLDEDNVSKHKFTN